MARGFRREPAFPLMASAALVLAACGTTTEPSATPDETAGFQPSFAEVTCPEDVELRLLVPHACGHLTALEDRSRPDGATVSVFVVRMDPPGEAAPDPMLAISGDIGNATEFGGMAPLAGRVHRIAYVMEPRGVGHSEPNLACPEVDELAVRAIAAPSGDPQLREAMLEAVQACRDRLTADGVEVAAYDAAAAAGDVVDLGRALGIEQWNLIGFGSQSRILIEAARQDTDAVRTMVLDSPQLPAMPDPLLAARGLDDAIASLARACAADAGCDAVAPNLPELLDASLVELDANPLTVTSETGSLADRAGEPVQIRVDGGTVLRVVRSTLGGDGPAQVAGLPSTIASAAAGEVSEQVIRILGSDPTLCAGYRPLCVEPESFSLGAYLSVLCRDDAPFLDLEAADSDERPAYGTAFGDNPYLAACVPWAVPAADDVLIESPSESYPLLVLVGELDAFVPHALVAEALSDREEAYVVRVPAQTHNVLGFSDCALAIRNAWVDDPEAPPADASCLDSLTISFSGPR